MNIEEFITKIEDQFDDIERGKIKPDSILKESFEWNSINALIIIALIKTEYDVDIDAEDLRKSKKVQELYELILKRKS
jgi:acyl carrier protein